MMSTARRRRQPRRRSSPIKWPPTNPPAPVTRIRSPDLAPVTTRMIPEAHRRSFSLNHSFARLEPRRCRTHRRLDFGDECPLELVDDGGEVRHDLRPVPGVANRIMTGLAPCGT